MDIARSILNTTPIGVVVNATSNEKFKSTSHQSSNIGSILVIIVLIMIAFWITTIVASYRIVKDNKVLHAVLCAVFGIFYIAIAWIIFGFSKPNSL
jgi:hypothetical protein